MKRFALPFSLVSVIACSFVSSSLYAATPAKSAQVKSHKSAIVASHKQIALKKHHRAQYAQQRFQSVYVTAPAVMAAAPVRQLNEFKLKPRVSVWALSGHYTLGKGQVILPFSGDQSHSLFAIAEGDATGNGTWFAGAGLGYRQIANDHLYGGYLIADYTVSRDNNSYLIANPGMEIFGNVWDFNANAYIAINSKKKEFSTIKWADEFGVYDYLRHTGHYQYNRHAERTDFESVGQGVDVKIGRTIPGLEQAKVYVGGYYFKNRDAGSVTGGLVKATYDLNKYVALEATDSYDGYNHNKVILGVKLTLGGYNKQEKQEFGLSSRLTDTIDHGYSTTIVPIKKVTGDIKVIEKDAVMQYDNIWFYDQHGGAAASNDVTYAGDGTYEHPFSQFNPESFHYVTDHYQYTGKMLPRLYVEGPSTISLHGFIGAPIPNGNGMNGLDAKLLLPPGWGIYGWKNFFTSPADGENRPLFIGGIDMVNSAARGVGQDGDVTAEHNVLDSIMVHETGETDRGLGIIRAENASVTLNNVVIGADTYGNGGYNAAVYLQNSELDLYDTDILATNGPILQPSNDEVSGAIGIVAGNSKVTFVDGTNNVIVTAIDRSEPGRGVEANYFATGIDAVNSSAITFAKGINSVTATVDGGQQKVYLMSACGIHLAASSVAFYGEDNTVSASNQMSNGDASSELNAYGIHAEGISSVVVDATAGASNTIEAVNVATNDLKGKNVFNQTEYTLNAYGIYSDASMLSLNGDIDHKTVISATNTADYGNYTLNAYGLYVKGYPYTNGVGSVHSSGNGLDTIRVENNSENGSSVTLNAYGIKLIESGFHFGSDVNVNAVNSVKSANNAYLFSYGINAMDGNGTISFDSGDNGVSIFAGNSVEGASSVTKSGAVGIFLGAGASADFLRGTNNIAAENNIVADKITVIAYSIYASDASVVVHNGTNYFDANNYGKGYSISLEVAGILLDNSTAKFLAGTSNTTINNTADYLSPPPAGATVDPNVNMQAWGILGANGSSIVVSGGDNSFTVSNIMKGNSGALLESTAVGVYVLRGSAVDFEHGSIVINAYNGIYSGVSVDASSKLDAYGIRAENGITNDVGGYVNFALGAGDSMKIDVGNLFDDTANAGIENNVYGIFADGDSSLNIRDHKVEALGDLLGFVDIKLMDGSIFPSDGYKIEGNGLTPIDWGTPAKHQEVFGVAAMNKKYDDLLDQAI